MIEMTNIKAMIFAREQRCVFLRRPMGSGCRMNHKKFLQMKKCVTEVIAREGRQLPLVAVVHAHGVLCSGLGEQQRKLNLNCF